MGWVKSFRRSADQLRLDAVAAWLMMRDSRTPWIARVVSGMAVAYAFSPIDLIPDFVPVLGIIDDAIVIPFLLWVAFTLVPAEVQEDCRRRAIGLAPPKNFWAGIMAVMLAWVVIGAAIWALYHRMAETGPS